MKIAIAHHDDAATGMLRRILLAEQDIRLVWVAKSGHEVLAACRAQSPDLLLLDLALPHMAPGELSRRIMAESPCSILLLDSAANRQFSRVFEALGNGATDAALMPAKADWPHPESWRDLLSRVQTLRTLMGQAPRSQGGVGEPTDPKTPPVVAIGASTGGPKALATVLSRLPADFPAAVVIVQHLDVHFTEGLATSLDECTPLPVAPLTGAAALRPGQVWVAAKAEHLIVNAAHELVWTDRWPDRVCRPSIDVFFDSLAEHAGLGGCGVLLTGMGRDGAAGLLALRRAGFHTAAQDAESCVVYGMPKAAAELDAAEVILPIDAIGGWILETLVPPMKSAHISSKNQHRTSGA